MLTINYHSIKDISPIHNQQVFVIYTKSFYGEIELLNKIVQVELEWVQYDDRGYATGTSICFDLNTDFVYKVGDVITDPFDSELTLQLEWTNSKDYLYWIDSSQYLITVLKDINYES